MSAVAKSVSSDPPSSKNDAFPSGIPFIVGNEIAERFSFYGMKAILYVYLTALSVHFVGESLLAPEQLAAAKAHSTEIVHLFVAGAYMFPLIGAVLADRLFGKFNVILWVSLLYCVGHGVLAVAGRLGALGEFDSAHAFALSGLVLIAMGAGGIKPCVSANVGDQFSSDKAHLVTRIFQIFYFSINFGSFFSTLLTPYLYKTFGPELAFGVPGLLMAVATFIFWLGRNRFVRVPAAPGGRLGLLDLVATVLLFSPLFAIIYGYFVRYEHFDGKALAGGAFASALLSFYAPLLVGTVVAIVVGLALFSWRQKLQADSGFLAVLVYAFRHQAARKPGEGFFSVAKDQFGEEAAEGPPAVLRLMLVFSMVSVFWALFDQHASTWVEQAGQMNLTLTVPSALGKYLVGAVVTLSLGAGAWMMLYVANVKIPSVLIKGVLGVVALGALVFGGIDLIGGRWETLQLQASQLSALNPLLVMLVIPLLNVAIYAPLQKRGVIIRPLQKMTVGMFLAATAFVAAAVLQLAIEKAGLGQVHALWQIVPYLVMTVAEVLVSATGLEFAYTQAPRAMKSTIMGFWMLCVAIGNLLVAFLAPLQKTLALSQFFWLFAGLMGVAAAIFGVMAYLYKGKSYLQQSTATH